MYAHFELKDDLGLDEDRKPNPGFVVRTQSKRRIQIWGNEGPWSVETSDDDVATARIVRRVGRTAEIEIKGGAAEGTCMLHAFHGARMSAWMVLWVLDPREVSVNFHFFTTGPSRSTLTKAEGVKMLEEINQIYEPQSFVKFRVHRMESVQDADLTAIDFAKVQEMKPIWTHIRKYLNKNFPAKQKNVFFVRDFGAMDKWICKNGKCAIDEDVLGVAKRPGKMIIVDKSFNGKKLVQILAHELGHSLGLKHEETAKNNLMLPSADTENVRLRQVQALRIGTHIDG